MSWALIATTEQELTLFNQATQEWQTIMVQPGTIVNLIVYDGVSPYEPPTNTKLEQVPDNAEIGDTGY